MSPTQNQAARHPGERRDRGDTEVDLGAEQDERDPGRRDRDRRDLGDDVLQIPRRQEDIGHQAEEDEHA